MHFAKYFQNSFLYKILPMIINKMLYDYYQFFIIALKYF